MGDDGLRWRAGGQVSGRRVVVLTDSGIWAIQGGLFDGPAPLAANTSDGPFELCRETKTALYFRRAGTGVAEEVAQEA